MIRLTPYKINATDVSEIEKPYGVDMINAPTVWDESNYGTGVVIAVLDTGVDTNHPDLTGRVIEGKDFTGTGSYKDDNGHGTHVAGTIAAIADGSGVVGVAPKASLLAYKVLDSTGSGENQWAIDAINAAIDWKGKDGERVKVINMSFSSEGYDKALHGAVKAAVNSGITVICSAGNTGDKDATTDEIRYPASFPETISVGAVDSNKNMYVDSSSNNEVDVVAPGVDVKSTQMGGGYITMTGTSMAAPHVTGAAALLYNMIPDIRPSGIKSALTGSATSLGYNDNLQGSGLINLESFNSPKPEKVTPKTFDNPLKITAVYDKNMKLVAYLENAFKPAYWKYKNKLWRGELSLPIDDPKAELVKPFYFVQLFDEEREVGMFRVMPTEKKRDRMSETITFKLEHAMSTLLDNVIFRDRLLINMPTRYVLQFILNHQEKEHWVLGQIDFDFHFTYHWSSEKLYNALNSVPRPFADDWMWTFDTTTYPFTLNLVRLSEDVSSRLRYAHNLQYITKKEDPREVVTRLYCLGYGSGINQLSIESVNPTGKPYIEAEPELIEKYKLVEDVFVDPQIQNAKTLYNVGQSILNKVKFPPSTYIIKGADVYPITKNQVDQLDVGDLTLIDDEDLGIEVPARVVMVRKHDTEGAPGNMDVHISTRPADVSDTVSELRRRARIQATYAQGACFQDSRQFAENANPTHPAILTIPLSEDFVYMNKAVLEFKVEPVRAYITSTKAGGEATVTSLDGGGETTTANGDHRLTVATQSSGTPVSPPDNYYLYDVYVPNLGMRTMLFPEGTPGVISTYGTSGNHTHGTKAHRHKVNIPGHEHPMEYGIFEGGKADSVEVIVDGQSVGTFGQDVRNINLLPFLTKDSTGRITRDRHEIKLIPNKLTRLTASVTFQPFIMQDGKGQF